MEEGSQGPRRLRIDRVLLSGEMHPWNDVEQGAVGHRRAEEEDAVSRY